MPSQADAPQLDRKACLQSRGTSMRASARASQPRQVRALFKLATWDNSGRREPGGPDKDLPGSSSRTDIWKNIWQAGKLNRRVFSICGKHISQLSKLAQKNWSIHKLYIGFEPPNYWLVESHTQQQVAEPQVAPPPAAVYAQRERGCALYFLIYIYFDLWTTHQILFKIKQVLLSIFLR